MSAIPTVDVGVRYRGLWPLRLASLFVRRGWPLRVTLARWAANRSIRIYLKVADGKWYLARTVRGCELKDATP